MKMLYCFVVELKLLDVNKVLVFHLQFDIKHFQHQLKSQTVQQSKELHTWCQYVLQLSYSIIEKIHFQNHTASLRTHNQYINLDDYTFAYKQQTIQQSKDYTHYLTSFSSNTSNLSVIPFNAFNNLLTLASPTWPWKSTKKSNVLLDLEQGRDSMRVMLTSYFQLRNCIALHFECSDAWFRSEV